MFISFLSNILKRSPSMMVNMCSELITRKRLFSTATRLCTNIRYIRLFLSLSFNQKASQTDSLLLSRHNTILHRFSYLSVYQSMCQPRPLFCFYFLPFLNTMTKIQDNRLKMGKALMMCLGFEPRTAVWKAQTNPLSYGLVAINVSLLF